MTFITNSKNRTLPITRAGFLLSFAAPLLWSGAAQAEACGDTPCPKGFECVELPGGCPAIACFQEPCPPCTPEVEHVCRALSCDDDADCASGMSCAAFTQTECSGEAPGCSGRECGATPAESSCVTTTVRQCAPRWTLPCETATDCGDGFTCEPMLSTRCSGSDGGTDIAEPSPASGTAGASGSGTPGREPAGNGTAGNANASSTPNCVSEPTGQNVCKVIQTACTSDGNCLPGFTCQDNPNGTCWADSDGNSGCTPADPAKLCMPPHYEVVGASGALRGVITNDAASTGSGAPVSGAVESAPSATAGGGGCTVSARPSRGGVASLLALIGLGFGFGVRRRRASI